MIERSNRARPTIQAFEHKSYLVKTPAFMLVFYARGKLVGAFKIKNLNKPQHKKPIFKPKCTQNSLLFMRSLIKMDSVLQYNDYDKFH
jgi:hypothetical protein